MTQKINWKTCKHLVDDSEKVFIDSINSYACKKCWNNPTFLKGLALNLNAILTTCKKESKQKDKLIDFLANEFGK